MEDVELSVDALTGAERLGAARPGGSAKLIPRRTTSYLVGALLLPLLAAGCGARSSLETGSDAPRVADCERWTPDAVPLGRLVGDSDPWSFASDGAYLYFISDARVFRVAKAAGAPQALTPPGFGGGGLLLAEGSLFWKGGDHSIYRVPTTGGDPEVVGAATDVWTIANGALITTGLPGKPAPVLRTPLDGGPATEILPADSTGFVSALTAVDGGVLVQRSHDLVLVPLYGAPVTVSKIEATLGTAPVTDGEVVYFSAGSKSIVEPALQRTALEEASTPEVVLDGWPDAVAIYEDTLYTRIVLPEGPTQTSSPDDPYSPAGTLFQQGNLVRVPKAGGAPTVMTTTDAFKVLSSSNAKAFGEATSGLTADAAHVYFIELCTDVSGAEYRLVSLPVDYAASP